MRQIGAATATLFALLISAGAAAGAVTNGPGAARQFIFQNCPQKTETNLVAITGLHAGGCAYGQTVSRAVAGFISRHPRKISGALTLAVTFDGQRQRLGCTITGGEIVTCGHAGHPYARVYLDSGEDLRKLARQRSSAAALLSPV
jgi:hypothetical protein